MAANNRADRAAQAVTKAKQAQAMRHRADGLSYEEIAVAMNHSPTYARKLVLQGMREIIEEPATELIQLELGRLDTLYQESMKVLRNTHPYVNSGAVIYMEEDITNRKGEVIETRRTMLEDCGPRLSAIDRCLRIQERRAKLLGLDKESEKEKEPDFDAFAARLVATVHAINKVSGGAG